MKPSVRPMLVLIGICSLFLLRGNAAPDGEAIYKAQCLKCHGENGDGNGHADMKIKPADLRSPAVQKLSDEELFKTVAYGVGHKDYAHAFAERGMDPKQIAEVVAYIRKFAKTSKNK